MNKKVIYLIAFLALAFAAFYMYQKYRVAPAVNFTQLSLTDLNGQPVQFSSFKGKKTVVCFSASWCPNCRVELKDINQVKGELPDVEILVISDEPLDVVNAFKEKMGYPFTFLKMNQSFNAIGINSIPVSYLFNINQEVKKESVGYLDWKDPSTLVHLKKIME